MLTLYYAAHTCALATHIALEEAGADYNLVRVDFAKTEQCGADYLKVNPKGRVPALATEHGVLTETPALLIYVAERYSNEGLAPLDDAFDLARTQAFNSYLCSTVHVAHAHRMRGHRWADDEATIAGMQRAVPRSVAAAFQLIEDGLLKGPWVLGERFSVCDAYLFTLAQWLEADGVDPARFPRVIAHRSRVSEREAVKRAIEAEVAKP